VRAWVGESLTVNLAESALLSRASNGRERELGYSTGGAGSDRIIGKAGDDLLIAGMTASFVRHSNQGS